MAAIMAGDGRVHVFTRARPVGAEEAPCPTVADVCASTVRIYSEAELAHRLDRQRASRSSFASPHRSRGSPCCTPGRCSEGLDDTVSGGSGEARSFAFDGVFDEDASQGEVFEQVGLPVLRECLKGFNGTILAYGQTGSGKTHSLLHQGRDTDDIGLLPRLVACLFVHAAQDIANVYEIEAAALQVYNEQVDDLLHPDHLGGGGSGLTVQNGGTVPGLTWVKCDQPEVLLSSFMHARTNIVYAETKMNKASSRSHAVFQVKIRKRRRATEGEAVERMECTHARLNVVDLAGSERVKKSGVEGMQLREASAINRSLLAFGNVVSALAAKRAHVPFRESKLTRILDGSIGGNTKTSLLVCVSPSAKNVAETLSTLEFASRAMSVEVDAKVNVGVVELSAKDLLGDLQSSFENLLITSHKAELDDQRRCSAEALERSETEVKRLEAVAAAAEHGSEQVCERAESDLVQCRDEISQLQEEGDRLRDVAEAAAVADQKRAEELEKLRASHTQEKEMLVAEMARAHDDNLKLQADMEKMGAAAEGKVASERARGDQLADKVTQLEMEAEQSRATICQQQDELSNVRAALESGSATERMRCDELTQLLATQTEEVQRLELELGTSQGAVSQHQSEVEKLRASAETAAAARKEMEDELEKLRCTSQGVVSQHQSEVERLRSSAETAAAAKKEMEDELEKLRSSQEEARRLQVEMTKAQEANSKLQADFEILHAATEASAGAQKAKYDELEQIHGSLTDDNKRVAAEAASFRDRNSRLQAELERLRTAAEGEAQELKVALFFAESTRIQELEESHAMQADQLQQVEDALAVALNEKSQQHWELEEVRIAAEAASAAETASVNDLEKLRNYRIQIQEEMQVQEAEIEIGRDSILQLQAEVSRLKEFEKDAAEAQSLVDETAKAQETISQLQAELERLQEATSAADELAKDELQQLRTLHAKKSQKLEAELETARAAAAERLSSTAKSLKSKRAEELKELEKLQVTQSDKARRQEANFAKARDTISQQKAELEKLRISKEAAHAAERALADELEKLLSKDVEEKQRLEAEVAKARDTILQQQAELETLQGAVVDSEAGEVLAEELRKLLNKEAEEKQRLEAEVASARDTISQQQAELETLQVAVVDSEAGEVQRLEAEVGIAQDTISRQQAELDRFHSKEEEVQKLEAESARWQQHAESESLQVAAAHSSAEEVQKLQAEVANHRSTISQQQADLERLQTPMVDPRVHEVQRLEGELASHQSMISQQQAELERLQVALEDAIPLSVMENRAVEAESQARSSTLQVINLEDAASCRDAELEEAVQARDSAITRAEEAEHLLKESTQEQEACAMKLATACMERNAANEVAADANALMDEEILKANERIQKVEERAKNAEARGRCLVQEMQEELQKSAEPAPVEDHSPLPQNWIRIESKGSISYINIDTGAESTDLPPSDRSKHSEKAAKQGESEPKEKDAKRCAHDEELRSVKVEAEEWQEHALQCCKRMQKLEDELRVLKGEAPTVDAPGQENQEPNWMCSTNIKKSSSALDVTVNVPGLENQEPNWMRSRNIKSSSSTLDAPGLENQDPNSMCSKNIKKSSSTRPSTSTSNKPRPSASTSNKPRVWSMYCNQPSPSGQKTGGEDRTTRRRSHLAGA